MDHVINVAIMQNKIAFLPYCSITKNILRHFPYLKVFISNSKLQFVKTRVPNKKYPKPQYSNIYKDPRFRFVYLSVNIYKYLHNI